MQASIVFHPGLTSDDGRCLSWWYDIYTRESEHQAYWNYPHYADTHEDAVAMCNKNKWTIISDTNPNG